MQETMKLTELAGTLADEASENGASRVVFRTRQRYIFTDPDSSSIAEALITTGLVKYKLQHRLEGTWRDVQGYRRLPAYKNDSNPSEILDLIATAQFSRLRDIDRAAILSALQTHPDRYARSLRALYRTIFLELARKRTSHTLTESLAFLQSFERLIDPHADFLRTTLELYKAISTKYLSDIHHSGVQKELYQRLNTMIENEYKTWSNASKAAAENVMGKVASLFDRNISAQHFRIMSSQGAENVLDNFYLEKGANTYLASSDLAPEVEKRAFEIRRSIAPVAISTPENELGVLVGMDPNFYRIYAPQILFYAQQLPDVDFNILLCAPVEEAHNLVEDGRAFLRGLESLNRGGFPENVHHYQVPVPSYVRDHETFFASARFFAIELMLERYQTVYLMDADLSTDVDPRPYFSQLSGVPFSAPKMLGFFALYPWRRYMAGNVAISRAALESNILPDLQEYLVQGLSINKSWTLDQNALTYAIERNNQSFVDLNTWKRPFYQGKFRLVWEERLKKALEEGDA